MTLHIQRPMRAPRTTPIANRPGQPPTPMVRALLHALAEHGGLMPASALAERTGMEYSSLRSTIWMARAHLMPVGGLILSTGASETLAYEIQLIEPDDVIKVAGAPVPRAAIDAYLGFTGINATVLRTIAEAKSGPILAADVARAVYGKSRESSLKRVRCIALEVRRLLGAQKSALTILDVETPDGPAFLWGSPTANATAPGRRTRGITLAPCGYAEWSYEPASGVRAGRHTLVFAGEDQVRALTEMERAGGLTTAQAKIAQPETEDADA